MFKKSFYDFLASYQKIKAIGYLPHFPILNHIFLYFTKSFLLRLRIFRLIWSEIRKYINIYFTYNNSKKLVLIIK